MRIVVTLRAVAAPAVLALALCAPVVRGQTAVEHVALGDREREASNAVAALRHYESALAAEPHDATLRYATLWKAAMVAVDAGETATEADRRTELYRLGERYARRAVEANPDDAEGHFALARALGRTALSLGRRERVRYAAEVRSQALEALRLDPRHAGALHVMGAWNAEVVRLNGMERFMARNFLGGRVFGTASWKEAQRYLEQALAIEPDRLVHRLLLAEIYAEAGNNAKAREQIDAIARAPMGAAGDARYKRQAEQLGRTLP
jgi:tetratricopeptide (TPR) repeat protein